MKKLMFKMKKAAFAASLVCVSANVFGIEDQNVRWFEAVESSNLVAIDQMIERGINLNVKDRYERTALLIAVEDDKEEVVKHLIKGNHNLIAGMLVEMLSTWKNKSGLSRQGVRAWKERFDSAVMDVNIREEGITSWTDLLDGVPDRRFKWSGWTPLAIAVGNKNEKMVRWLLREGADVNVRFLRSPEVTPLMIAAIPDFNYYGTQLGDFKQHKWSRMGRDVREQKQERIMKLLIDAGADVHARSSCIRCPHITKTGLYKEEKCKEDGKTALDIAVEKGFVSGVKLLLNKGVHCGIFIHNIQNSEISELIREDRYGLRNERDSFRPRKVVG